MFRTKCTKKKDRGKNFSVQRATCTVTEKKNKEIAAGLYAETQDHHSFALSLEIFKYGEMGPISYFHVRENNFVPCCSALKNISSSVTIENLKLRLNILE